MDYKPFYSASYALVIGIDSYSDDRFTPLGLAEEDATTFAAAISAEPYEFQTHTLLGAQATRQAILNALHDLRGTDPDARIIVYFAGHGYTLYDRYDHPTGYLAAHDTQPDRDFTALRITDVMDLTRHTAAKHVSFIFDSCYSAAALGLIAPRSNLAAEKYLTSRVYQALTAGEDVVDDTRSMTDLVIQALQSGTIDPDTGLFTLSDMGEYVRDRMVAASRSTQIPQYGYLPGSQGGDFILQMQTGPRLPSEVFMALNSENAYVRAGGVQALIDLAHEGESELAQLAREELDRIRQEDQSADVRKAAQTHFDMPGDKALAAKQVEAIKKEVEARETGEHQQVKPAPPARRPTTRRRTQAELQQQIAGIGLAVALVVIFGAILLGLSGVFDGPASPTPPTDEPTAQPTTEPTTPPTVALTTLPPNTLDPANFTYDLGQSGTFTLEDGTYQEGSLQANLGEVSATGEIDNDGTDDLAVTLSYQVEGTGTFIYVVALINEGDRYVQGDFFFVGDRTPIREMQVTEGGTLFLEVQTFGPDDPLCCPSQLETWQLTYTDGDLTRTN